jgi:hypothetical protein
VKMAKMAAQVALAAQLALAV